MTIIGDTPVARAARRDVEQQERAPQRWGVWSIHKGWLTFSHARGVECIACWPSEADAAAWLEKSGLAEYYHPARMASL